MGFMKKTINLGLIGLGTVGMGVVKILRDNLSLIEKKVGTKIKVKKICDKRNIKSSRKMKIDSKLLTTDVRDILNDPEIDIVVELIGGEEPARRIILEAMKRGKHIVTANKSLLAKYWDDIFSCAEENKVSVYFEASVAGGVPLVQSLNEGLAANRILSIFGILNGTTNYILTKMTKEGVGFKEALKEAQKKGFAEANPELDIEGIDVAQKIAILSSIAFGSWINPKEIFCEGITSITQEDIKYAREEFGYILKLLAIVKNTDREVEVRVHPTLVPVEHLLASVDDEFNAIYIVGDAVGETMFYGKGAGQMAAASAVVSDIIYLSRNVYNGIAGKFPYVTYQREKKIRLKQIDKTEAKYYIRFSTIDRPGVLAKISGVLGINNVSIASCYQKERAISKEVPIIMITHKAKEGDLRKALQEINKLSVVRAKSKFIRILD